MSFALKMAAVMSFVTLGALAGYIHLVLVSRQIHALLSHAHGAWVLLALGRFPATAAAFALAAWQGALPLVAALAGFLIIRTVVVRCRGR